jgi:peptidoglycan/xylan/chitin deacetylase (PgdA/CDA1 family)
MALFWGVGLVLLIVGALILGSLNLYNDIQESRRLALARKSVETYSPPVIEGTISEQPDAMILSNNIQIAGEAADSVIISLKVNGKIIAVTLPQDGRFAFTDISLGIGDNEIVVLGMDANGNAKVLQKIETNYGSPRLSFLARDVTRGRADRKEIALTFDGGAGNGATDAILDILREKDCQCTMFLTGQYIKRYPEQVKQMLADGHEIGNHTWSHPHLTSFADNHQHDTLPTITRKKLQEELAKTSTLFHNITGRKMKPYWRAPFGEHNREIRLWAAEIGYRQIGWSNGRGETMDSMDWVADTTASAYKSSDEILLNLLNFGDSSENGPNGSIVLMHLDTQRKNDPVHRIIPTFVDSMRARGYTFTNITNLLRP